MHFLGIVTTERDSWGSSCELVGILEWSIDSARKPQEEKKNHTEIINTGVSTRGREKKKQRKWGVKERV